MSGDFMRAVGSLALANRLKRLSELMMTSGRKLYKDLGLDIEPGWYLVFLLLEQHDSLGITEMANCLGYAHPSVVVMVGKMANKGYVELRKDERDGRKQRVVLSEKARAQMDDFKSLWRAGERAMEGLMAPDEPWFELLERLEWRLQKQSFQERTLMELESVASPEIRLATKYDKDSIDEIVRSTIQTGETYALPSDASTQMLEQYWFAPEASIFVFEKNKRILGTYFIKPNHPGRGAHVANAAYMVREEAQ
ncbi:MAG: MarR family winged helix-turn-helix transcriptional regulator, partial [Myxococcota bacterium]